MSTVIPAYELEPGDMFQDAGEIKIVMLATPVANDDVEIIFHPGSFDQPQPSQKMIVHKNLRIDKI